MAKMFYSLEEAAKVLGITPDDVNQLAEQGKLQQFRDRDQLMFKRDQVEELAGSEVGTSSDDAPLPMADTRGETDAIDIGLTDEDTEDSPEDAKSATGISVFDVGEVEDADPMAQTVVSGDLTEDQDELALESVGSGSGLLDLTRESDDTSLGADLMEEIMPGGSDQKMDSGSGFEGIFDSAGGAESAASAGSDLDAGGMLTAPSAGPAETQYILVEEASDPVGSGFAGGLMFVVFALLVIGFIMVYTAFNGIYSPLTQGFAENFGIAMGASFGALVIFGVAGFFIGKAGNR